MSLNGLIITKIVGIIAKRDLMLNAVEDQLAAEDTFRQARPK